MDWGLILAESARQFIGPQAVYFAIAAIGLNIHFGYTGLLNFGHAGFLAVGAYGLAITVDQGGPWPLGVVIGLLAATVFALLLGIPTLRLRADYLAIVTIASSEIIRILVRATSFPGVGDQWREWTGGSQGINGFNRSFYSINPYNDRLLGFAPVQLWSITVGWALVFLSVLIVFLLMRSPWGRALKAVREDEDAVRALGKNAYVIKMQSLVIGGLFGALGGMLFVLNQGSVQPTPQDLGTPKTFFIWVAMILGGTARLWGPVIGSMIFSGLLSFTDLTLRAMVAEGYVPEWLMDGVQVGQMRFILMGLGLMLLMIFRPQGIFGDKRELALDAR
ncbi:MAG: branched-chain amino acid ABC transporter permease [Acidimicrobiales bacterium]